MINFSRVVVFLIFIFVQFSCQTDQQIHEVWLDELPLQLMEQGKRRIITKTTDIQIADSVYSRAAVVRPISSLSMDLKGQAIEFEANVGRSHLGKEEVSYTFYVIGDQKVLWKSKALKRGEAAEHVKVSLRNIQQLGLLMLDDNNARSWDDGLWANARFKLKNKARPQLIDWEKEKYILTPPPSAQPQINTPKVFGLRPNHPLVFTIATSGEQPISFQAENLPQGVQLDSKNGRLSGSISQKGIYTITLIASNSQGSDRKTLQLNVGDTIALTPPLGWNSWNCWVANVDEAKVRASAKAMIDKGLVHHGWSYVNIDDDWQGLRGGKYNAIQPNEKFPNMAGLIDTIHQLGLKAGIYSSPWVMTYAAKLGGSSDDPQGAWIFPENYKKRFQEFRYVGKYIFDQQDVNQWVDWGIDYLKYDWKIDTTATNRMNKIIKKSGRDIVFSLSNTAKYAMAKDLAKSSNCWRTSGDIRDTWQSILDIGFAQSNWHHFSGPGHWNDPDMLVVGEVTCGTNQLHPSRLSPDEQYSHISLWTLLAAPMLIGCPIEQMDEFTTALLSNNEVIAVNQDPLGQQAQQVYYENGKQIWAKPLEDGAWAVGLFYTSEFGSRPSEYFTWKNQSETIIQLNWSTLGIEGKYRVRDLWRQKDLGVYHNVFKKPVPYHGVLLLKLSPESL